MGGVDVQETIDADSEKDKHAIAVPGFHHVGIAVLSVVAALAVLLGGVASFRAHVRSVESNALCVLTVGTLISNLEPQVKDRLYELSGQEKSRFESAFPGRSNESLKLVYSKSIVLIVLGCDETSEGRRIKWIQPWRT
jgi:hypothetical protein